MENSQKRPHYGALDTLRGLCVIQHGAVPRHVRPGVSQGRSRTLVRGLARLPLAAEHLLDLYPPLGPVLESLPPPPAPGPDFRGLRGGDHPGHLAGHAQPAHPLRGAEPAGPLCPAAHPPGQGPAEAAPLAGACGGGAAVSSSPGAYPGATWASRACGFGTCPPPSTSGTPWRCWVPLAGFSSTDYFPCCPGFSCTWQGISCGGC